MPRWASNTAGGCAVDPPRYDHALLPGAGAAASDEQQLHDNGGRSRRRQMLWHKAVALDGVPVALAGQLRPADKSPACCCLFVSAGGHERR
jgi:hypothetical protein